MDQTPLDKLKEILWPCGKPQHEDTVAVHFIFTEILFCYWIDRVCSSFNTTNILL